MALSNASRLPRSRPRSRFRIPAPALLLAPSFLVVSVFVYVFVTYTIGVALSKNWRPAKPDFARNDPYVVNGLVTSWTVRQWNEVLADG